ncbi:membrane-associated progesterone receptor component 1 [Drosophila kikkawai]|uniref:Membrane-associated progesterone receptor component 1 n=1 Tax=Drosophila kikkawai TaxID=30033 RepID=A0A6P4J6N6_DROKI|nr:membrane-associated progesterone receptor component 1 [Drosophila kikkawai]
MSGKAKAVDQSLPWYSFISNAIKDTPLDVTLLVVSAFVFYKVVSLTRRRRQRRHREQQLMGPGPISLEPGGGGQKEELSPLRSDFTVAELREYNGTREDGRILVAINFSIYDVSRSKHYYGRNGVYPNYAGRDISRNLINFSVETNESEEFDDFSDLSISQMSTLREWDQQFREKYPLVGKLLREGELHTNYEDEDEEAEQEMHRNQ